MRDPLLSPQDGRAGLGVKNVENSEAKG